jgi:AcrR family transcriptional regulator
MKSQRIDIAGIRRDQIVEAAIAVIAEQGIQNLSLSEIEKKARMSRGQLTYYFAAKEEILLAVFDRTLHMLHQRIRERQGLGEAEPCPHRAAWEWIAQVLNDVLLEPPLSPEFLALEHTFLSQIGHRDDYRRRLASLYEDWRAGMARGMVDDLQPGTPTSPRTVAALVQAVLHGLGVQLAADPDAFDRHEMRKLCLDVLGSLFQSSGQPAPQRAPAGRNGRGAASAPRLAPSPRKRSARKKVIHE